MCRERVFKNAFSLQKYFLLEKVFFGVLVCTALGVLVHVQAAQKTEKKKRKKKKTVRKRRRKKKRKKENRKKKKKKKEKKSAGSESSEIRSPLDCVSVRESARGRGSVGLCRHNFAPIRTAATPPRCGWDTLNVVFGYARVLVCVCV